MGAQDFDLTVRLKGENSLSQPADAAGKSLDGLKDKVGGLGSKLAGLAATLGIGLGFKELIGSAFAFNSEVEDSKIAIAGMVQIFNRVGGEVPSYTRALEEATVAHDGLRAAALSTAFQLRDLSGAYQAIYAQATLAGFSTEETVKFTQTLAQLAKAQMKSLDEVAHGMSLVLGGTIRAEGSVGALMKSLGISAETIASWKAGGKVFSELTAKFQPMIDLAPVVAQTWTAAASNLKDAFSQMLGEGMGGAFESAKKAVLDFTASMVTVGDGKFIFNAEILARVRAFSDAIAQVIPHVLKLASALFELASKIGPVLDDLAPTFNVILDVVTALTHGVAKLDDSILTLAATAWAASKAMGFFGIVLPPVLQWLPTLGGINTALTTMLVTSGSLAGSFVFFGTVAATLVVAAAAAYALKLAFVDLREENEKLTVAVGGMKGASLLSLDNLVKKYPEAEKAAAKLSEEIQKTAVGDEKALIKLNAQVLELQRSYIKAGAAAAARPPMEKAPVAVDEENLLKIEAATVKAQQDKIAASYTGFYQKKLQEEATYAALHKQQERDLFLTNAKSVAEQTQQKALIAATTAAHNSKMKALDRERVLDNKKQWADIAAAQDQARGALLEGAAKEIFDLEAQRAKVLRQYDLDLKAAETEGTNRAEAIRIAAAKRDAAILEANNKETLLRAQALRDSTRAIEDFGVQALQLSGQAEEAAVLEARQKLDRALADFEKDRKDKLSEADQAKEVAAIKNALGISLSQVEADAAMKTAAIGGNFTRLWALVGSSATAGVASLRDRLTKAATYLENFGTTAGQGIEAGIMRFAAGMKTATERASEAIQGILGAGQTAIEDTLNAIALKTSSLADVMKSLGESIVKVLTHAFAQILMAWLMTGDAFAANPLKAEVTSGGQGGLGGLFKSLFGSGGGGSGGLASLFGGGRSGSISQDPWAAEQGFAYPGTSEMPGGGGAGTSGGSGIPGGVMAVGGGAIMGYGIGSALGKGNTVGKIGGTVMGAGLGLMTIPGLQVVGAVVAALGAIVTGIGALLAKSTNVTESISGGDLPSRFKEVFATYQGGFADLLKASGADAAGRSAGMAQYRDIFKEFNASTRVSVTAGSAEDRAKDWDQYYKTMLPKTLLSMSFGQTATGGLGAGAYAGTKGVPEFVKGSFDPDAPIPKMLKGLGFTAARIKEIAGQIDDRDPEAFMTWLNQYVRVVATAKDLATQMGRTGGQTMADLEADAKKTAAEKFKASMDSLSQVEADVLDLSGDEQIKKADEVEKAIQAKYDEELQFIDGVRQMISSIHDSTIALKKDLADALKTPEEIRSDRAGLVAGAVAKIGAATTPEEVQAAVTEAQNAIKALADELIAQVLRAREMQKTQKDVQTLWGSPREAAALGIRAQADKDFLEIQKKVAEAQGQSGQEQLDTIAQIQQAVRDRYAEEVRIVESLRTAMKDLDTTTNAVKTGINDALKDENWLNEDRKRALGRTAGEITAAMTPEEVQAAVTEAQNAIKALADELIAQVLRAREMQKTLGDTRTLWGSSREAAGPVDIEAKLAEARNLSGQAQLDKIAEIDQAVRDRYAEEVRLVAEIRGAMADVEASTKAAKADLATGLMTDQQKHAAAQKTVQEAGAAIGAATTPAEVQAAVGAAQAAVKALADELIAQVARARQMQTSLADAGKLWASPRFQEPLGIAATASRDQADLEAKMADARAKSGTEQLDAIALVEQAVRDRYAEEQREIADIRSTMTSVADSTKAAKSYLADALKTQDQLDADARAAVTAGAAGIGAATTPAEVAAAVASAQAAIRSLADGLIAQAQRATAMKSDLSATATEWGSPRFTEPLGVADQAASFQTDLQTKLMAAMASSGDEQLNQIQAINDAVRDRYQIEAQLIGTIRQNMADLGKSIESQKWDIAFGMADDPTKKAMYEQKLAGLSGSIAGASTPEELKRLTDEYQSLISGYIGQFGADSPNREEAKQKALDLLDQLQADADARYKALEAEATANHDATAKVLTDAQTLLVGNEAAAADALQALSGQLDALDALAQMKLTALLDSVTANHDATSAILTEAADLLKTNEELAAASVLAFGATLDEIRDQALARYAALLAGVTGDEGSVGAILGAAAGLLTDNENTAAAALQALSDSLDTIRDEAKARYDALLADATTHQGELQTLLDTTGQLLVDNETAATKALGDLSTTLDVIDEAARTKLNSIVDDVVAANARVIEALDLLRTALTTTTDTIDTGGGGDGGGGDGGGGGTAPRKPHEADVTVSNSTPTNLTLSLAVKNSTPEEIGGAVTEQLAEVIQPWIIETLRQNNLDLVSYIRQHPEVLTGQ